MSDRISFGTHGDIGDVGYMMPLVRHVGGADVILSSRPFCRFITYFDLISPLYSSQPYVKDFRMEKSFGELVTYQTGTFRPPKKPCTLTQLAGEHVGIWPVDITTPWLQVKSKPNGRVIFHRSARYRNDLFPIQKIFDFYGDRLLMVGQKHEHDEVQKHFGKIEFHGVKDYLELAEIIAGSFLFVGNQSSPNSIATGLGHHRILETCLWASDCIYPQTNAQYCYNGCVTLPNDKGSPLVIAPKPKRLRDRNVGIPGGHKYSKDGKDFIASNFSALVDRVRRMYPHTTEDEVDAFLASSLGHPFVEETQGDFSLVKHVFGLAGIPYP